jgi:lipopolysaccharide/colanic/teichoic acid biosynthesis glycosyltransferase
MQYLERYSPEQRRRHDVLPGITGWAQVNGRNAITWEDKFRLDVWYVDHWSFWLDVRILLFTLWKVITREGVSQPGHATAEEFMGSADPHKEDLRGL